MNKSPILKFRDKLRAGRRLVGTAVTFSDPLLTEAVADAIDFFWYDMEHCKMSFDTLKLHLLAARGRGCPSIVRVTTGDVSQIKPALDAGADGIIVPQVKTVQEVRDIVAECRYAPAGRRGFGPRVPGDYGRIPAKEIMRRANREVYVTVMIETREAVEAIEQILALPGLDGVVLGPMDLSIALGVGGDVEHARCIAAQKRVIAAARKAGKSVGAGMGANAAYARKLAARGVQWLQVGSDFEYVIQRAGELKSAITGGAAQDVNMYGTQSRRGK